MTDKTDATTGGGPSRKSALLEQVEKARVEASEQAKAGTVRLARSFDAVFGREGARSEDQRAVLEHLRLCAGEDSNSYRFSEGRDGISIVAAGIHRDGAQSILRIIERQLHIAAQSRVAIRAKPQTVR
jgi:hypothetical protein